MGNVLSRCTTLAAAAALTAIPIAVSLHAQSAAATAAQPPAASVDFVRDIQPILSDNCYFCHGPDANKRHGDLRLDVLDPKLGPFAPRDGYEILSPGKIDDSVLIMRITSDDPEFHMPPLKSNRKLTDDQIAHLSAVVIRQLRYLGRLRSRMEKLGFTPQDRLYAATTQAFNGVHQLRVELFARTFIQFQKGFLTRERREQLVRQLPQAQRPRPGRGAVP